jgi:hypothetical protein
VWEYYLKSLDSAGGQSNADDLLESGQADDLGSLPELLRWDQILREQVEQLARQIKSIQETTEAVNGVFEINLTSL